MHACPSRRQVLLAAGGGAGALALAACSGGGGDEPEPVPAGQVLAALSEVPVGGALVVTTAEGVEIALSRPSEEEVLAFSAICTHQGCTVRPDEGVLYCPCHGSEFDQTTGEVLRSPAEEPLPTYQVVLENGNVVTA